MGISESIMAASIGAAATITTALFQLFMALRSGKPDQRRKKASMVRSAVAIAVLMIASAAGGYVFAEYRQQLALEDVHAVRDELRGMRDEMNARLQTLTAEHPAPELSVEQLPEHVEATLLARGCGAGACDETSAEHVALCGTVPHGARAGQIELYVGDAPASTSADLLEPEYRQLQFEQDGGGAKFTGAPVEVAQDARGSTVCVDFAHWSAQPQIARMVVQLVPTPPAAPTTLFEPTTPGVTHLAEADGLSGPPSPPPAQPSLTPSSLTPPSVTPPSP